MFFFRNGPWETIVHFLFDVFTHTGVYLCLFINQSSVYILYIIIIYIINFRVIAGSSSVQEQTNLFTFGSQIVSLFQSVNVSWDRLHPSPPLHDPG